MGTLILLRHGQSVWNQENKFTGWVDVELSTQGINEAHQAGKKIKSLELTIDEVFCSELKRAIDTATIALSETGQNQITTHHSSALNERHYGDLQGLNKDEMRQKYGPEQVHIWRRSFDVKPPNGESLKDTCERAIPYYIKNIEPLIKTNKCVLVVAHGNSIRGLIKKIEQLSDEAIIGVEIPTGTPIIYNFDNNGHITKKKTLN